MQLRTKAFIRRAERDDLDVVVSWMEDPDFLFFLYGDPARSPKQIREQIVTMLGRTNAQTLPGAVYLIIDTPDEGPLGLFSLQNISWRNRSCSIDFYIGNKKHRNHLMGALAFYRAMAYCFDELNLHRVTAYVYSFNEVSWRVFEKSGAKRELTLRDHVARDGKLFDVYAYGLLRGDFEAFRQKNARLIESVGASMLEEPRREGAVSPTPSGTSGEAMEASP